MVSFHTLFPKRKMISDHDDRDLRKRKWDDVEADEGEGILLADHKPGKNLKATAPPKSLMISDNIELHLETPLPSEWQRCLDIQSGEIYFYNTRTRERTAKDPRESSPEGSSPQVQDSHMSLDLELNLPCSSSFNDNSSSSPPTSEKLSTPKTKTIMKKPRPSDLVMSPSNVTKQASYPEAVHEEEVAEMVATACMRCHMLVILCKSSPTCPNCKFVHPPYQTPPDLFKPRGLSLSC